MNYDVLELLLVRAAVWGWRWRPPKPLKGVAEIPTRPHRSSSHADVLACALRPSYPDAQSTLWRRRQTPLASHTKAHAPMRPVVTHLV